MRLNQRERERERERELKEEERISEPQESMKMTMAAFFLLLLKGIAVAGNSSQLVYIGLARDPSLPEPVNKAPTLFSYYMEDGRRDYNLLAIFNKERELITITERPLASQGTQLQGRHALGYLSPGMDADFKVHKNPTTITSSRHPWVIFPYAKFDTRYEDHITYKRLFENRRRERKKIAAEISL